MSGLGVALLTPCFWPEVRRGAERFVAELGGSLAARGHRPRVITSHPGRPGVSSEQGFEVVRSWRPPAGRLRRRMYEDHLTHVPFSYLALARGSDDVAVAVYPTDALAAARWTERGGGPSVHAYMGIPTRKWLSLRRRRAEITLDACRRTSATTALSRAAADAFRRELGVEARVIHPGVNLDVFRPVADRDERPVIFCGAAVDQPQKRVDLLCAAFAHVRCERPDAVLRLSRPRDPRMAERVEDPAAGIELADVDDTDDLAAAYSSAWVSALPSRGEAFGLVLVEALACGTPVVGSDLGGISEIVDRDEIGRLFAGEDERVLAARLVEALDLAGEPGTRDACRARAADFSAERCAASYEELFRELLAR